SGAATGLPPLRRRLPRRSGRPDGLAAMATAGRIWKLLGELGVSGILVKCAELLFAGAATLDEKGRPEARGKIARWLREGSIADLGKLGTVALPLQFDRVFGTRPLSFQFIW